MRKPLLPFLALCFLGSVAAQAQTAQLIDVAPGAANSDPGALTVWNNKLYFIANDTVSSGKMMTHDASGLSMTFKKTGVPTRKGAAVYNNKLYFTGRFDIPTYGEEVYSYDGISAPQLVANIMFGSGSSSPHYFFNFNNKLYFCADNFSANTGVQLYSYDGVNAPTIDWPGNSPSASNGMSYSPDAQIVYNGKLYFTAYYASSGGHIYALTPGTPGVFPVFTSTASRMLNPLIVGADLYFTDGISTTGAIWRYSGSGSPVKALNNSAKRINYIGPFGMAAFNGSIYFGGSTDSSSKPYFFRYDLTSGNVSTLAGLYFDNTRSLGEELFNILPFNGALYLSMPMDAAKGRELYKYDGTTFTLVSDINPGAANSDPMELTDVNGTLYFTANSSANGRELYKLGAGGVGIQSAAWGGSVTVYPNPVTSSTMLSVKVSEPQELRISVYDAAGKSVYQTGQERFAAGQWELKLPMGGLPAGQYYYHVDDKNGRLLSSGVLSKL